MLKIGDTAPHFASQDQQGNAVDLDALTKAGPLILYFYPADFSPVCTAEACAFRDNYAGIEKINAQIVGISPQGQASHARFSKTYSIPFPLLSDSNKSIIKSYGVEGPLGFGVRRATFLINQQQIVENRVVSDLFVGSHTDLLKQTLKNSD